MDARREVIPASLAQWLTDAGRVAVALSGGVDSGVLLAAAVRALGSGRCLAVTAVPPYVRQAETEAASALAGFLGVRHLAVRMETPEAVANNPPLRCYHCKRELFSRLLAAARGAGFELLVDGTNDDDRGDYRPGMRALAELGVASPWLACGIGKKAIRETGRLLGLPASLVDAPASPCLLTRLEHGMAFDAALLDRIERAESWLAREIGGTVRLRCLRDGTARVELEPERLFRLQEEDCRQRWDAVAQALGWERWSVDPAGYRCGNMNTLP